MITNKINVTLKVATISLALALTSCGGDKSETSADGEDAGAVALKHGSAYNMFTNSENKLLIMSFNFREILDKMNLDNLDLPPEVAMGYAVAKPYTTTEYLGLNIDKPIYGFVTADAYGEPEYVAYTLEVSDPKKFEGILNLTGVNSMIESLDVNGESFSMISENGVTVLWDDKDILAVMSTKGRDTREYAKSLLSFRGVDGPDSPELTAYFGRSDDFNALYLMKDMARIIESNGQLNNVPDDYLSYMQDGSFVLSANFNAGEMIISSEVSADKFKNSDYNMFNAKSIDPSFNNYLTNDKLIAAGMLSLNMDVISSMTDMFGVSERDLNDFKNETGMELADFLKIGTGEFAFSFNGMEGMSSADDLSKFSEISPDMTQEEMESLAMSMNNDPVPSIIFTIGIKDSTSVGNMIRKKAEVSSKDGYYSNGKDSYMIVKNDKVIITTSEATATFFGSGSAYPSYQLPNGIDGSKNAFGFMNTTNESLPNGFVNMMMENKEGQMALGYLNQLESITGEFEFDEMSVSVKSKDKSKNILELIANAILEGIKQDMEMSSASMEEEWDESEF